MKVDHSHRRGARGLHPPLGCCCPLLSGAQAWVIYGDFTAAYFQILGISPEITAVDGHLSTEKPRGAGQCGGGLLRQRRLLVARHAPQGFLYTGRYSHQDEQPKHSASTLHFLFLLERLTLGYIASIRESTGYAPRSALSSSDGD